MIKKTFIGFLIWLFIFSFGTTPIAPGNEIVTASAKECLITLKYTQNKNYYSFNDIMQDPMETAPVNKWSRLFLVIRYVTQNIPDTSIQWIPQNPAKTLKDGKNGIVIIETTYTKPARRIEFFIGYHQYKLNGQWLPIEDGKAEVTPFIVNGRTLIPLRRTAESLNAKDTLWDQASHTATLLFSVGNCENEMELIRIIKFTNSRPFQKACGSLQPKNQPLSSNTTAYRQIIVDDCHYRSEPGEPVLAAKTIETEIPKGWEIESVAYVPLQQTVLPDLYELESGQVPYNEFIRQWEETDPDVLIYNGDELYPKSLLTNSTLREQNDQTYLLSSLTPIQLNPVQKKITFFQEVKISIRLKKASETPLSKPLARSGSLPKGSYKMVIISQNSFIGKLSDAGLKNNFAKYAQWKTSLGVPTLTYDLETIQKTYPGNTTPAKIKNFIRDAKTTWGIQFVLLGGDVDSVPSQTVFSKVDVTKPITQATFPSDSFYACLGQNEWQDGNHDQYLDDYNKNMDMLADVYVGRVSVRNQAEIQNFFEKQEIREKDAYHTSAFLFGGLLSRSQKAPCNESKYAWGECYLESLLYDVPVLSMMKLTKKYQLDGSLNSTTLISDINQANPDLVFPQFHGQWDALGALTASCQENATEGVLFIDQLDNLKNPLPFLWVTGIPCMTNCFDTIKDFSWNEEELATFNTAESMSEKLLRMKRYGAYAYIGNAHYGWFDPYSIANSASYQFEKEFLVRFLKPNAILGKAFHESKEVFIPKMARESDYRWVYHSLNLLGDPSFGYHGETENSFSTTQKSDPIEELENGETAMLDFEIKNLDTEWMQKQNQAGNTRFTITSGTNVLKIIPEQFELPPGSKQVIQVMITMSAYTTPGSLVPFSFHIENELGEEEEIHFEIRCKEKSPVKPCCAFTVSPDWNNFEIIPEGKPKDLLQLEFLITNTCSENNPPMRFGFRPDSDITIIPIEFSLKPGATQLVTMKLYIPENAPSGEILQYPFYYSLDCGEKNVLVDIPVRCAPSEIPGESCAFKVVRKELSSDVFALKPGESQIYEYAVANTCQPAQDIKLTLTAMEPSKTNPSFDPPVLKVISGDTAAFRLKAFMPLDAKTGSMIRYVFEVKADCGKTAIQTFSIQCKQQEVPPSCCQFTAEKNAIPAEIKELKPGESYFYNYTVTNTCNPGLKDIFFSFASLLPGNTNPMSDPSSFILQSGAQKTVKVIFTMPIETKPGMDVRFIFEFRADCGEKKQQYFIIRCAKESVSPPCCDWMVRIKPGTRQPKFLLCPGDSIKVDYYEIINLCPQGSNVLNFTCSWTQDSNVGYVSPSKLAIQPQEKKSLSVLIKMPNNAQPGEIVNFTFTVTCLECDEKVVTITAACKDCWCKYNTITLKITKTDIYKGWAEGTQTGSTNIVRIYFDPKDTRWKSLVQGKCFEICYEIRNSSSAGEIKWGLDFRAVTCP